MPRDVALGGGVGFLTFGLWAMTAPRAFFDTLATFEPHNQHFVQDISAFQVGLGVVLLLASISVRTDGLAVALLGVGTGATVHPVSHIVGQDLGGTPKTDIAFFVALAILADLSWGSLEIRVRFGQLRNVHEWGASHDEIEWASNRVHSADLGRQCRADDLGSGHCQDL